MGKCDEATARTWMVSATNSSEATNSSNSASERLATCSTAASACSPLVCSSGCRTDYPPDCCNLRIIRSSNRSINHRSSLSRRDVRFDRGLDTHWWSRWWCFLGKHC